jgi:uncharacterized protein
MNDPQMLYAWFAQRRACIIACSGGIDSLLLATLAHRAAGARVRVVHAVSPAVPPDATARVKEVAAIEGWRLALIDSGEFEDEHYLANPQNRCFHCKSHLYGLLERIARESAPDVCVVSGANQDDLGEYRPGLMAAAQHGVRHPYIELGVGKQAIRAMARRLELDYAELPASPCLASRLYTGTRVTPERLRFVNRAEQMVRRLTGCLVVRCRIEVRTVRIEVPDEARHCVDDSVLAAVRALARTDLPEVDAVVLDARAYAPGRAFVGAT